MMMTVMLTRTLDQRPKPRTKSLENDDDNGGDEDLQPGVSRRLPPRAGRRPSARLLLPAVPPRRPRALRRRQVRHRADDGVRQRRPRRRISRHLGRLSDAAEFAESSETCFNKHLIYR